MGTKSASSYTKQPRKPSIYGGAALSIGDKASSPYFYGVVTRVDTESRRVFFDVLSGQNIGPIKAGNALPFYKDNLTLPEVGDTIPLLNGPSPQSGILGEAGSRTLFYLPPISVDQELAQNTIVRTSILTPKPVNILPSNENYLAADNGFAFNNNSLVGAGTQLPGSDVPSTTDQNVSTYDALLIAGRDDRGGDKTLDQQIKTFKDGFGIDKNVKGFRYTVDEGTLLTFLKNNPNIPVFLFSAGCTKAGIVMKSGVIKANDLFIIEPFSSDDGTRKIIESAISTYKIPMKNVFSGGYAGTGSLINVNGQTPVLLTKEMGRTSHWAALTVVGKGYINGFSNKSTTPQSTTPTRTTPTPTKTSTPVNRPIPNRSSSGVPNKG